MGKLICDTAIVTTETFKTSSSPIEKSAWIVDSTTTTITTTSVTSWDDVTGLEDQQRTCLHRLYDKGILWKHPEDVNHDNNNNNNKPPSSLLLSSQPARSVVFRLSYGGEVSSDGNCLFTASQKAMSGGGPALTSKELRRRTVKRFLEDLGSASGLMRNTIDDAIKHMYSPDLKTGWGVHVVQEVKLLARKVDRQSLDSAIDELVHFGMQRELAAESIYSERCVAVEDSSSWAKYMSISGSIDDEYDIVTLQYTEDGLLSVDENREGRAAAFGDDIAIECLATEFKREIYVVQAHGSDAMVDEENCVFFLPHRPRSEICEPPLFLFMKGAGWCGAGADHYEPLIAHPSSFISHEKVALTL